MPTKVRSYVLSLACLFTLAASQSIVRAQGGGDDLQTFSPEGEVFSVDMPKDPKVVESEEPYHRMTITTRFYLSTSDRGPLFAAASLRGIKVDPKMYTEMERFNSYDDAFRRWFPQKVRGKDAVGKFTLVGNKMLNGNPGREYRVVIGDLSGTAQVYLARRFYAFVILNTKKDDALADRFLGSLVLPEKTATPLPTIAANPQATMGAAARTSKTEAADEAAKTDGTVATTAAAAESKPTESASTEKPPGERAPISGGVLNGKAVYLPQPEYPAIAAQAHASGMVTVQVLIDEVGNVISAHAVAGHPLLQAAAVAAARQARFSPTSLMGEPVKVTGVIQYNFVAR